MSLRPAAEVAREFCDELGCTTVHVLRDELPALVERVRAEALWEAAEVVCTCMSRSCRYRENVVALIPVDPEDP